MTTKSQIALLLWFVVPSILFAQSDEEYSDVINIYKFSGTSEVVRHHLDKLGAKGRFHVLFLVPTPRIFVYGEALISYHIDQLHQAAFKGSVSIILRGKRYWADQKYVRANRWNAPTIIDADGALLKPIKAWDLGPPLMTIWDSTGTLWWWAALEDVPTGKGFRLLLDSLDRSSEPLLPLRFVRTLSKPLVATSVGHTSLGCANTTIRSVIELQDDSSLAVGPLSAPVISGNGKWLAAFDYYRYSIRIYQLPEGTHIAELRGDTSSSRKCSWLVSDTTYYDNSRFMWAALTQPAWADTVLVTLHINSFIKSFSRQNIFIDKKYYVLGYYPPNWRIGRGAEFAPMTRTFCTGEYCAEGTFYPGGGFVLSKERFYLPFRRGYLAMGSDTSMVRNPYENPLQDTFYTYAPLYGAFSLETGIFLDSTVGALNEKIGQRYGLGLAFHDPWHMSCDQQTDICAWVQWLSDAIEVSDGRRIPLRHYWNASMLDTTSAKRRSAVPKAREVQYFLDSAGAKVNRVLLTPSSVYVLWKVKEVGFALNDQEHGFYVLQEYDRTAGTFKGQWQLPARYNGQQLLDVAYDATRNSIAGLYQGAWKTTLAYFDLP